MRFCGQAQLPTRSTKANWLRQITQETLAPLVALNSDLVTEALARLGLPRVTIDVDGSVIRTAATVGWAFRGFNPHHRKDPSLLPALGPRRADRPHPPAEEPPGQCPRHQAGGPVPEGGHRRPPSPARPTRGAGVPHGRRLSYSAGDSRPARRPGLRLCDQGRVLELAAAQGDRGGVPPVGAHRARRHRARDGAGRLAVERYATPRGSRIGRTSPTRRTGTSSWICSRPDDGHYEYTAVDTNLALGPAALWAFACGRGAEEKTIAELKGEVRARRHPDEALRSQQCVAATRHPRAQPDPKLPVGQRGGFAKAAVTQADVHLCVPQPAHAAIPSHRPGGAPDPPRGPERTPPEREPSDGGAVWGGCSPPGRLVYLPFGISGGVGTALVRTPHASPKKPHTVRQLSRH